MNCVDHKSDIVSITDIHPIRETTAVETVIDVLETFSVQKRSKIAWKIFKNYKEVLDHSCPERTEQESSVF